MEAISTILVLISLIVGAISLIALFRPLSLFYGNYIQS